MKVSSVQTPAHRPLYSRNVYANRTRLEHRELLLRVSELEQLTLGENAASEVKKVEVLAMYIARSAPNGRVANLAMKTLSAAMQRNRHRELEAIVSQLRRAILEAAAD